MRNKTVFIAAITLIIGLSACVSPKEKARENITQLEQSMFDSQTFTIDPQKAEELLKVYRSFVDAYPEDTLCPDYLYKMAEVKGSVGKHGDAVVLLDELIQKYGDWKRLPDAMFLKGFILEDKLHNLTEAQKAYQRLIDRFPGHAFSENARVIINNLGVSADSLVRRFEAMQTQEEVKN